MKTNCSIQFLMEDVTAKADGTPSATDKQPWVDLNQIHDEIHRVQEYGTLEPDQFVLNGRLTLLPGNKTEGVAGLWSRAMSDENGVFVIPPVLTVTFSKPHDSIGITLTSCAVTNDFASMVAIEWFDAFGATLEARTFNPDEGLYFCGQAVEGFRKVKLTFAGTNKPFRYLKLYRIMYGALKTLGGDALIHASVVEEISPVSDTVSVNTLGLQFHSGGEYDLIDPRGVYSMFQQRQKLVVTEAVDDVTLAMGTYYLSEPSTEGALVTLSATDLVGVIEGTNYMGGLWLTGTTAQALLADIMKSAGTTEYYMLESSLQSILVRGYLPICTHRAALQQLAFAIGAVVSCARSDKIRLFPLSKTVSHTLTPDDKLEGHKLTQTELVTGVEVYAHNYRARADKAEVFKESCPIGKRTVSLNSPATELTCVGAALIESGVNHAVLNVTTVGVVTLTGRTYDDQKSLAGAVYTDFAPVNAAENVKTVEDCTLMADAQGLAQRLYDNYQHRIKDEGELLPVTFSPSDCVSVTHAQGRTLTSTVTSMDIDLTGGFISQAALVGT